MNLNLSWTVRLPYEFIDSKTTTPDLLFKFVVNGDWQNPPGDAPNAMLEPGTPHMNLSLPRHGAARPELLVQTAKPIDLRSPPIVTIEGLHEKTLRLHPTPGAIMDTLYSDVPMGVTLDRETSATLYRLFAPRATNVQLGLFDGPYHTSPDGAPVEPTEIIAMTRLEDGVWETRQDGLHIGQYYAFRVEGSQGNGEGFNPNMNSSGVGNDVASERPMMRRLIVENILFWVEEYGIDGFRFDLGELIDDATLLQIERVESHDDYSLVDELSLNPNQDGRELSERDERIHKLAATLIMGSLGDHRRPGFPAQQTRHSQHIQPG